MSRAPIEFPDGVDGSILVRDFRHSAWTAQGEGARRWRREVTKYNPGLFGLIYFHRAFKENTEQMSFSPLHWDLVAPETGRALRWTLPRRDRLVVVAPRGAAKSTWLMRILPIWLVAHGHRRFPLLFSFTKQMIGPHWGNLRDTLGRNKDLLRDFPELAPVKSTLTEIITGGGAAFACRALGGRGGGGTMAGLNINDMRPDYLAGDDMEPFEGEHSRTLAAQIQQKIITEIMPMGSANAVTVLAGTTTMDGSLIHDAVKHARGESTAPWIAANGFECLWYPAIYDEGTEHERSMWPQRWRLTPTHIGEWLRSDRGTWLNMMNRPEGAPSRGYWTRELIRYRTDYVADRRILRIDPAVTSKATSDQTAIQLWALDRFGRFAVLEESVMARFVGDEMWRAACRITAAVPETCKEWYVEANQGGELHIKNLSPVPKGVNLELVWAQGHKRDRINGAIRHYQDGRAFHRQPFPDLEDQMVDWTPKATEDDGCDCAAGGLDLLFPSVVVAA